VQDAFADEAEAIERLLGFVARGELQVTIGATYALADAHEAHRALDERRSIGKLLLLPHDMT